MKNENIYIVWSNFINNDKYKNLFDDSINVWINNLNNLQMYINSNKKIPSTRDKNKEIKMLGRWTCKQKNNHLNNIQIMKNENIYVLWDNFLKINKDYFYDNLTLWKKYLDKVKKYIYEHHTYPKTSDENEDIKKLGYWFNTQNYNHVIKKNIMKNKDIYDLWKDFKNSDSYTKIL